VDRISPRPKLFKVDTEFYQPFVIIQYSKLSLRNHAEITIERILYLGERMRRGGSSEVFRGEEDKTQMAAKQMRYGCANRV